VHSNSAFALALAIDYARRSEHARTACVAKALAFFAADRDLPAQWEPSGADFVSR
jgi:hypothetical protein